MVRVVVIVKWGLGLTKNSWFCRHGFIRFHDEATVKDKVKEKDVNIPPCWCGDVCKVKEKDVNIPPCWCGDVCKVKVSTD